MKKNIINILCIVLALLYFYSTSFVENKRYIVANLSSSKSGVFQIFYDTGKGFNEKESIIGNLKAEKEERLKLRLPNEEIKALRIDPINLPKAEVSINKIYLQNSGKSVDILNNLKYVNGAVVKEGGVNKVKFMSVDNDPIFVVENFYLEKTFIKVDYRVILSKIILLGVFLWLILSKDEWKNKRLVIIITFLSLILRNADSILNPIIYTEDGPWISKLIYDGVFKTMWSARTDYFVFGNILLLYIPLQISRLFFGYNLTYLPYFISITSYIFYSLGFTYIYFCMDKYIINRRLLKLFYILLILIPLGDTSNEILGRISNIGYIIPVFYIFSILEYEFKRMNKNVFLIITLSCILTNPLCIPLICLDIFFKGMFKLKEGRNKFFDYIKENIYIILSIVSVSLIIIYRYKTGVAGGGVLNEGFQFHALIEGIIARGIYFPFVFSHYNLLNDKISILLGIAYLVGIFMVLKKSSNRVVFLKITLTLFIYLGFTYLMRPGLTNWINGYKGTFPDRYFWSQNILSLIVIFMIFDFICSKTRNIQNIIIIMTMTMYVSNLSELIEFSNPRMKIRTGNLFKEEVIYQYDNNSELKDYTIPLYFDGWNMMLPSKYIEATVEN